MVHTDHVQLIKRGLNAHNSKQIWADFGSGEGAFTLALRDVAGENIEIFSVDKDLQSLTLQEENFNDHFPDTHIHFQQADFTKVLMLPKLDGIIAANSLHYVGNKIPILQLWRSYLKSNGRLIIVEYNVDQGNTWVPYPFSFETLQVLTNQSGFQAPELLGNISSEFLNEMYSAVAIKM